MYVSLSVARTGVRSLDLPIIVPGEPTVGGEGRGVLPYSLGGPGGVPLDSQKSYLFKNCLHEKICKFCDPIPEHSF